MLVFLGVLLVLRALYRRRRPQHGPRRRFHRAGRSKLLELLLFWHRSIESRLVDNGHLKIPGSNPLLGHRTQMDWVARLFRLDISCATNWHLFNPNLYGLHSFSFSGYGSSNYA